MKIQTLFTSQQRDKPKKLAVCLRRLGEVVAECLGIHSEEELAAAMERSHLRGGAAPLWGPLEQSPGCSSEGAPQPDLRADLLLAGLAAEQVRHWVHDHHQDVTELARGLSSAALALAAPSRPQAEADIELET